MTSVALLSDTHMRHEVLEVPIVDVLVHCGDFTRRGSEEETIAFLDWYCAQPAAHRLLCAGNHDLFAEREPARMRAHCEARGLRYLASEPAEVAGLRVWGSPVTPYFRGMAFNVARGARIRRVWEAVPAGLDLLFTHGPPFGLGDKTFFGAHVGCEDLRDVVAERSPRVHAFGHIHEDAGEFRAPEGGETRFLNVATSRLVLGMRTPVVLEL